MLPLTQTENIFVWCCCLLLSSLFFVFWSRGGRNRFKKIEIPTISFIPYLFTLIKMTLKKEYTMEPTDLAFPIIQGIAEIHKKEKMFKVGWANYTYVVTFGATTLEDIFNSSLALNKDWLYAFLHQWLGTGLITSGDDKWRTRRKMLTPTFHFRILKDFLPIFNEQSMILIGKLKKLSGKEVEITELLAPCTLDIIGESAMGVHLNAQMNENLEYSKAIENLTSTGVKWFFTPWYWISPLFNLMPIAKQMRNDIKVVHDFSRKVIETRKSSLMEEMANSKAIATFEEDTEDIGLKKRIPFMDLLLYNHLRDKSLTEEGIREEVDTFTFAGYDTTLAGLSWTLYLLGLHKDIQNKVYQEIESVFGDDKERPVTTDDLTELKYLECVIKESLRIYPPVPFIMRRTNGDIETGGYTIPANTSVLIFIYGIHRDQAMFPNPEVFDPDRFLPENCKIRHPFAFVPFSFGQRNCIGQRFAMMELKTIVTNVLRNFKVHSLDQRDKLILVGAIVLRSKHGIRLIVENR